jgi:translation initiation factor IF-3
VGDNIETPGIYSLRDALKMADALDLDLVEISPKAEVSVPTEKEAERNQSQNRAGSCERNQVWSSDRRP